MCEPLSSVAQIESSLSCSNITNQERKISPKINNLTLNGNFNLYLFHGTSGKLIIETDEKLINEITSETKGQKLIISNNNISQPKVLNIFLTLETCSQLNILGKVNARFFPETTDSINIWLMDGESHIKISYNTSELFCHVLGFGSLHLDGNFKKFTIQCQDEITAQCNVISEQINCTAVSNSYIAFEGITKKMVIVADDKAIVDANNLNNKTCTANIFNESNVLINTTDKVMVIGNSNGTLKISGNPGINLVHTSDEFKIIKNSEIINNLGAK